MLATSIYMFVEIKYSAFQVNRSSSAGLDRNLTVVTAGNLILDNLGTQVHIRIIAIFMLSGS